MKNSINLGLIFTASTVILLCYLINHVNYILQHFGRKKKAAKLIIETNIFYDMNVMKISSNISSNNFLC